MRSDVYKDWIAFVPNIGFDLSAYGTLTFTDASIVCCLKTPTISSDFSQSPTSPLLSVQLPEYSGCVNNDKFMFLCYT
jgi:hypothetical protein